MKKISCREDYLMAVSKLIEAKELYYGSSNLFMSDYDYDKLEKSVIKYELKHPDHKVENSPTDMVGFTSNGKKVKHINHMTSMANCYTQSELTKWLKNEKSYILSPKFDGLAVNLIYKNGKLKTVALRGDGEEGTDITFLAPYINGIPTTLDTRDSIARFGIVLGCPTCPKDLEVRGEVVCKLEEFKKQEQRAKEMTGDKTFYTSPRSLVSGCLNSKTSNLVKLINLDFIAYDIGHSFKTKIGFQNQYETIIFLKDNSFNAELSWVMLTTDHGHIFSYYETMTNKRNDLPWPTDGVVVRCNSFDDKTEDDMKCHHPKCMRAFKFPEVVVETTIVDIITSIGKSGKETPVAIVKPVYIFGKKITKINCYNKDYLASRDIRVGDTVGVTLRGDVIPQIVYVDITKRVEDIGMVIPANNDETIFIS